VTIGYDYIGMIYPPLHDGLHSCESLVVYELDHIIMEF